MDPGRAINTSGRFRFDGDVLDAAGLKQKKAGSPLPFLGKEELLLLHFVFFRIFLVSGDGFTVFFHVVFFHFVFFAIFRGLSTGVGSSKCTSRGNRKSASNQSSKQFLQGESPLML